MSEVERQPFARATFPRTIEYYREFWQAAHLRPWWKWFSIAIGAASIGLGFFVLWHPIGWVALAVGLILMIQMPIQRAIWLRRRLAATPADDNQMTTEFMDDSIVASTALAVSEVDWKAIRQARQHANGLALWLHGNSLFYIPTSSIEPPASVSIIVEKASRDSTPG
ncbi:MAG: hypothetical protein ACR2NP_18555 [Pirellulaceae bacterium]